MSVTPSPTPMTPRWRTALWVLFGCTVLNYLAQIPYYIHFYGVHHIAPAPLGIVLLALTLLVFLAGYSLTLQRKSLGAWLLLGFLTLEFVFYGLHDISGAFLHDLPTGDLLFLIVSLIGYLNTLVALIYLIMLLKDRRQIW